jgi:hypothetical protein
MPRILKNHHRSRVLLIAVILLAGHDHLLAQTHSPARGPAPKEAALTAHARGPFDVKLTPQPFDDKGEDPLLGRMSLDKQFHGDLEAASRGVMLSAGTSVKGSGGYVAIERVSGTLGGRSGSFVLQHSGTMDRNVPHLTITVVPDSGTGQLAGLTGKMDIKIEAGGKHFYDFDYTLPDER